MPRKSRIDTAGALRHIMVRGIDRRKVFRDDTDRDQFLERLGKVLMETKTTCFAWALIPNHFHCHSESREARDEESLYQLPG